MDPINNSNTPNHNLPPDMWDDRPDAPPHVPSPVEPTPHVPPASTPHIPPPPISPHSQPITPHPQQQFVKSAHRNTHWVQWWLTLIVILVVTGGVGYAASRYWGDVADWVTDLIKSGPITIDNSTSNDADDQVAWQQKELIGDLGLMKSTVILKDKSGEMPTVPAKYYKVGEFVSGPYKDQDLVIAALLMVNDMGGPVRFYYFAKSGQSNLILLTKHSPELSEYDGIDHDKFGIDNSYQIARLFFPNTIKNPKSNSEPLELVTQGHLGFGSDYWFDEQKAKYGWQIVFRDLLWGDVYTDPVPINSEPITDRVPPNYGFYLKAPDGTPRTYKLIPSILSPSYLNGDVPVVSWKDGSSSTDEYIMFEMGGCGQGNFAAVMPPTLLDELVLAGKSDIEPKIYEFKDKNHSILKALFGVARSRFDNKGLTYQKFLNNHPIFFWQDSFGRLIKFQNKKYMPLVDGCS